MKIAYAVPRYLPHLGGIENHVNAIATRMGLRGHEVTVATQSEGDAAAASVEKGTHGVVIRRFPSGLRMRGQGVSPGLWRWMHDGAGGADIVHIHNYHALSTLGSLSALNRGGQVVFTPHYLQPREALREAVLHRMYAVAMRRALRTTSRVVCVTPSEATAFGRHVGFFERCTVIPNGVDASAIGRSKPVEVGRPLVVMAGRLEPYKRPDLVLAALPYLPREYCLAFVGMGSMYEELQRRAEALGVRDRLLMVGLVPPAQVLSWYRSADVVVSLSQRECFGMTVAEGLAAGAAVLASDIGAHRDVLDLAQPCRASLVASDASPPDVAAAMVRLGLREAGSEPTSLPTWDHVAAQTEALYRSL